MDASKRLATLNRIRRLSRLMDSSIGIPLTRFKIGLDPIIGLLPGLGDIISTGFSAYIIFLAARFGMQSSDLAKMIFNVGLEFVIGAVPFLGDIFDAFYKSNIYNLAILEEHLMKVDPQLKKASLESSDYSKAGFGN